MQIHNPIIYKFRIIRISGKSSLHYLCLKLEFHPQYRHHALLVNVILLLFYPVPVRSCYVSSVVYIPDGRIADKV